VAFTVRVLLFSAIAVISRHCRDKKLSYCRPCFNFCSSPLYSKPRQKFVQTSYPLKSQFIGYIFVADSLTVKAHVHSVIHGHWPAPKATTYVGQAYGTLTSIGHSRSFKVILIGAGRNPERRVVVMCN